MGETMKYITVFITILLSVLISVNLISCRQQKDTWRGTIEEVDGITVVNNPSDPFFGEFIPELEEDIIIGNEDDDNYLFYRVRAMALDGEKNIYVVDMGNYRIQKFDSQGRYLQTIGRKGQGPGEFRMPLGICFDAQNNMYVREYKKIQVFDKNGDFIRSFPLDHLLVEFAVDAEGSILGYSDLRQRDDALRGIIKIDTQGKIIKNIAEYDDLGIKIIVGEAATFTLSPNHVYTPRLHFASFGLNTFVYGYASEYLLNLIDKEGIPLLRIRMADIPVPISQKDKDFIVTKACQSLERNQLPISKEMVEETIHFRKNRASYNKILVDDKLRMYVQRVKSVFDETNEFEFDIFNKDGYYLYRVKFLFSPEIIENGRLYDIYTNEETGEVRIKRFKIVNWDQIKNK
jgi:hypothetical protein